MQIAEDIRRQREDLRQAHHRTPETSKLARSAEVRRYVDTVWPALTAPELLSRLYSDTDFLARCAPELSEDERAALARPAARSIKTTKWTPADLALLDELDGLLEGNVSYLHAVVDEAQDLSAMQCRVVARRCPLGSVTVLGDLAQATTPWAPGDWAVTLEHLGHAEADVRPLTAGYRVPAEVLDVANRLLPHIASGVPPATSVRSGADTLRWGGTDQLVAQVQRCLADQGSVGVIVADAEVEATLARLNTAHVAASVLDAEDDPRVTVVPATEAKGLEFDFVIVLEPAAIVGRRGRPSGRVAAALRGAHPGGLTTGRAARRCTCRANWRPEFTSVGVDSTH